MDDRREREPRDGDTPPDPAGEDAAVFHVTRVGGASSRRPALLAGAVTMAVGGLALAAALGDGGRRPADAPATALREAPTGLPDAVANSDATAPPASPAPAATVETPAVLAIHTRAWGPYVYVQGDVFDLDTEVVVVSIWSPTDVVLEVRTVSMPGGSTAFRLGANDRFQLAFEVVGLAAQEVAYVHANAYDRVGLPIASARQPLYPPVNPGWWRGEGT